MPFASISNTPTSPFLSRWALVLAMLSLAAGPSHSALAQEPAAEEPATEGPAAEEPATEEPTDADAEDGADSGATPDAEAETAGPAEEGPDAPAEEAEEATAAAEGATDAAPTADAAGGTDATPDTEAEAAQPAPDALPDVTFKAEPSTEPVPSPGEMSDRLAEGLGEEYDGEDTWTAPTPVFALHGYLRMRGELMDTFWLGRPMHDSQEALSNLNALVPDATAADLGPDVFSRFRAFERRVPPADDQLASCVSEDRITEYGQSLCDVDTLQYANMRLRLSPELNVTEDVRVRMTFDALDNVVAGTQPGNISTSLFGNPSPLNNAFADTLQPGGESFITRRAWAEVRNRDLGELRFGRMPQHWGLGMVFNAGNGLDQDFSTDLDRVLVMTKLAGLYLTASYDFIAEGALAIPGTVRPDYDRSQLDDVDQGSFSVAHLMSEEEQTAALQRGELVLNGGLHFTLRHTDAILGREPAVPATTNSPRITPPLEVFSARMTRYTPDLWGQLLLPGIRIEAELAWHLGSLVTPAVDGDRQDLSLLSFGAALETEFRFLEDKLALYFNAGFATGDPDVEGLSAASDFVTQLNNNDTMSTFSFHPSYQVDMILWRNLMRQVSGAYYVKPGISYDFVKTAFGELLGARLDVIWSRASNFIQAPGNSENLGVELNAALYWRSEDGTDPEDGYHASLQYGVLFPLAGLGLPNFSGADAIDLETAQQLRLVLGVVF